MYLYSLWSFLTKNPTFYVVECRVSINGRAYDYDLGKYPLWAWPACFMVRRPF